MSPGFQESLAGSELLLKAHGQHLILRLF
jgi:hypothetical protein